MFLLTHNTVTFVMKRQNVTITTVVEKSRVFLFTGGETRPKNPGIFFTLGATIKFSKRILLHRVVHVINTLALPP
jgi:hypothetical protein